MRFDFSVRAHIWSIDRLFPLSKNGEEADHARMIKLMLGVIETKPRMARVSAVSSRLVDGEPEVRIEIRIASKKAMTNAYALKAAKKYLKYVSAG